MVFVRTLLNPILSFINNFFQITLAPIWVFSYRLWAFLLSGLLTNHFFFWKVSNYANAYWFLVSNKQVLYGTRYL